MPSISYEFSPDQSVFVITDGTVKAGVVTLVEIDIDSTNTEITYWILLEDELVATPFDEQNVYESCRAAPGYQDVVFLNNIEGSPSPLALDPTSDVVTASPTIATGSPLGVDMVMTVIVDGTFTIPVSIRVEVGTTFQNIVDTLNPLLAPYATASLYQNNIRITSATTGSTSSVDILDGVLMTGSPGSP